LAGYTLGHCQDSINLKGLEQNLEDARSLQTISIPVHSPFSSDYMVYRHLLKSFLFILATNATKTHPIHG